MHFATNMMEYPIGTLDQRKTATAMGGFTLLEMSIVIGIIALIISGILAGQSMMRSSQLQSVIGEVARYKQAMGDFRDKYHALPGDFTGATALWGSADGVIPSDAACETTIGTGTQTCDGNGDGYISWQSGGAGNVAHQYESFRAWQHLANAGMLDGNYSGVNGPISVFDSQPGINVPASKLPAAGYNVTELLYNQAIFGGNGTNYFPVNYQHFLQFGFRATTINGGTLGPVLTTSEALMLDSKMDDGLPGSGNVLTWQKGATVSPNCATSTNPATARYDMTQSGFQCSLLFLLGF
jgi:prepilin-type N-terminal cleavage/methylation domain-containing protein